MKGVGWLNNMMKITSEQMQAREGGEPISLRNNVNPEVSSSQDGFSSQNMVGLICRIRYLQMSSYRQSTYTVLPGGTVLRDSCDSQDSYPFFQASLTTFLLTRILSPGLSSLFALHF